MAFGGGSARDWQNSEQTGGRSAYESQSWRDNYNGGRAAGDFTGTTNARLDAERAAFQGATWSGSSSQPSALELARYIGTIGPGTGGAGTPGGVTAGPGGVGAVVTPTKPGVQAPAPAAPGKVVPGVGNATIGQPVAPNQTVARRTSTVLQQIGPNGPLRTKIEPTVQELLYGGFKIRPNPRTSNAEEWEIRYAEPGEWIGGIAVIGSDLGYNLAKITGFDSQKAGRDIRYQANKAWNDAPGAITSFARHLDETGERTRAQQSSGPNWGDVLRDGAIDFARHLDTVRYNERFEPGAIGGGF